MMELALNDPVVLLSYVRKVDEDEEGNEKSTSDDPSLRKSWFVINKPLVPLKFSQFFWFGGSIAVQIFLMVYLKSKGLTIAHLSIINIINPIFQFFGPSISGMIADKLGRSKPVMFGNIILILIAANCILLIPKVHNVPNQEVDLQCQRNTAGVTTHTHNISDLDSQFANCTLNCDANVTFDSFSSLCLSNSAGDCLMKIQDGSSRSKNLSFGCDQESIEDSDDSDVRNCSLKCPFNESANQDTKLEQLFILTLVLLTLFNISLTNIYRCMDLTVMSMAKIHNSDFGRERFWSIASLLIFPPLSAYLVDSTADESGAKNYETVFYLFDVMTILTMISLWKLDVQATSPGKKMWKKAFTLVKDLDVVVFILAIVVMGTCWGFKKIFTSLYLEELNAPSILYSLISTVSGFVGLPFLVTSNWWVKKIGSNNLVLCAFLAYAIDFHGYALVVNPWWCLLCETMNIFHTHLLWVAVVRHTHEIAPTGLTATVIATAGGIHYALGRSFGSMIGGLTMSKYGGREAFRLMGTISAVTLGLHGGFLFLRTKYKQKYKNRDVEKKDMQMNGTIQSCYSIELPTTPNLAEKPQLQRKESK